MKAKTVATLNQINNDFYVVVGDDFSASRQSAWGGFEKWADFIQSLGFGKSLDLLDVGGGNGRFGKFVETRFKEVKYTGLDSSRNLLDVAKRNNTSFELIECDFVDKKINDCLPQNRTFEAAVCWGVMHHIPGLEKRHKFLQDLWSLVGKGGSLGVSFWQFGLQERFLTRVVPWENFKTKTRYQIDVDDLEKRDYILDWKRGKTAYRYCHYCDLDEIQNLIERLSARKVTEFNSDGKTGDLNHYVILQK